jgi:hypothetical protein
VLVNMPLMHCSAMMDSSSGAPNLLHAVQQQGHLLRLSNSGPVAEEPLVGRDRQPRWSSDAVAATKTGRERSEECCSELRSHQVPMCGHWSSV